MLQNDAVWVINMIIKVTVAAHRWNYGRRGFHLESRLGQWLDGLRPMLHNRNLSLPAALCYTNHCESMGQSLVMQEN